MAAWPNQRPTSVTPDSVKAASTCSTVRASSSKHRTLKKIYNFHRGVVQGLLTQGIPRDEVERHSSSMSGRRTGLRQRYESMWVLVTAKTGGAGASHHGVVPRRRTDQLSERMVGCL